jgi:hypothetical protein
MAHDVLKRSAMKTATLRRASRSLRAVAAVFALASALGGSACKPVILGGHGEGGGGTGGTGGCDTGGHGGGGVTTAVNAIALPYVLLSPPSPPDGSSGAGGSFGVDPGTIYVQIGNFSQSCSAHQEPYCVGELVWQVSVGIPPALQVPGVLQLSDPSLISTFSQNDPAGPTPGECNGGGGSFTAGTLEIVSIDAGTIVVLLSGTTGGFGGFGGFDADGEYTAPICPTGV